MVESTAFHKAINVTNRVLKAACDLVIFAQANVGRLVDICLGIFAESTSNLHAFINETPNDTIYGLAAPSIQFEWYRFVKGLTHSSPLMSFTEFSKSL